DVDPAADGEQGREQDDEGEVLGEGRLQQLVRRRPAEDPEQRAGEDQPPEEGDLGIVVVPEPRRHQGEEGDREEDAQERQGAPAGEPGAQVERREGRGGRAETAYAAASAFNPAVISRRVFFASPRTIMAVRR